MAEDVVRKEEPSNFCCLKWKEKYAKLKERHSKLEEGRNALRQGLSIFEQQIAKMQTESLSIKKAFEDERARANSEKEDKDKESSMRLALEEEVSDLKSQILSLRQNGGLVGKDVEQKITTLQACVSQREKEINHLKELLEKEKIRGDAEKKKAGMEKKKADEAAKKVKAEKSRANEEGKDVEQKIATLKCHVSEGEKEINKLKELVENEKIRADAEKKKAEMEKKKADEAAKKMKAEKSRANEEKRLADIERKRVDEFRHQMEKLKCESDEMKLKLALETAKCEELNCKLNAERERTTIEKKRVDLGKAKVEEQRKAAEANWKKAMDERNRADNISKQLEQASQWLGELEKEVHKVVSVKKLVEVPVDQHVNQPSAGNTELPSEICSGTMKREMTGQEALKRLVKLEQKIIREKKRVKSERKKVEELRQVAEDYKKAALEEKLHADQLSHKLECYKKKVEEVQKEIQKLFSSTKMVESSPLASGECLKAETAEMKLLRKQLKFEKERVKHAKQVAKMEIGHNRILRREVLQLKQDLLHFSQRLDIVDDCLLDSHGANDLKKLDGLSLRHEQLCVEPWQRNLHSMNVLRKLGCTRNRATGGPDQLKQDNNCAVPLPPISGEICMRSNTGIDSKLVPRPRGCDRKLSHGSAINSSSASFSDGPLLGSQERRSFSVTTPILVEEIQNPELPVSGLSCGTRKSYNGRLAVGAENSVGSPVKCVAAERGGNHKKRKRLCDTVKPVQYLDSAGQSGHQQVFEKLSLLNSMLDSQMNESLEEERFLVANLEGNMRPKQDQSHKKRKSSSGEAVAINHFYDSNVLKTDLYSSGIEGSDVCMHASPTVSNPTKTAHAWRDEMDDLLRNFEEIIGGDCMKLLELENEADEERYQRAIERPISPTLPRIKFPINEACEINNAIQLPTKSSYMGFLDEDENLTPSCNFDAINLEIDSNRQTLNKFGHSKSSLLQDNGYSNGECGNLDNHENGASDIICISNASRLIGEPGMECAVSGKQDSLIPCESRGNSTCVRFPKYYVVFSDNRDKMSISRIFHVATNFMTQFSTNSSLDFFIQQILLALQKADDLSMKERVCVFLSLLLEYISEITKGNFEDALDWDSIQFIDLFAQQMQAVLSDMDTRRLFMEFCDICELLTLMEDFLLNRRLLVRDAVLEESMHGCDSRVKIVICGGSLFLSIQAASTHLLLAGGVLLAAISAATDHIGFLCEVSCDIFRMLKLNSSFVLRLLHVFAYLCGSEYFNLEDYSLEMSILKSLVVLVERLNYSTDSTVCFPSLLALSSKNSSCNKCPFLEGAASVDFVVTVLLEKLQEYPLSGLQRQDPREELYLSISGALSNVKGIEEISDFGDDGSSNFIPKEKLFNAVDILSLLELVACVMSWDWTFVNIVSRLLQILDSYVTEHLSTAIITLLGHLGRLGVDAKGYEDSGVERLRDWFSAFLCQITFRNFGLPVQFAALMALVGLIAGSFQEVVESNSDIPAANNQSVAIESVRTWFSSLSTDQKSSFMLLYSSSKDNITGNSTILV